MVSAESAFSTLPIELFLYVVDHLVESATPHYQPVAFPPNHPTTKALLALTRVSRTIYPLASKYLYANCIYIDEINFARFYRTLGTYLGQGPQDMKSGRNQDLWNHVDVVRYIKQAFIWSGDEDSGNDLVAASTQLPHVMGYFDAIGSHLKRLVLILSCKHIDSMRNRASMKEIWGSGSNSSSSENTLGSLASLEELVVNFDITYLFSTPPKHLKRLCSTDHGVSDAASSSSFAISSLRTLIFLRPLDLKATDIESWFSTYAGQGLDIILVEVNTNHQTPTQTRSWKEDDEVRVWEIDVPTSFYGDDEDYVLCERWIWDHARDGSMWEAEKRRMRDWEEVKKRLEKTGYGAGVHTSFDISQSSEWEPILPFQAAN